MNDFNQKTIPHERVLFFTDAIVTIAITLLALDLRLDVPDGRHLRFEDLLKPWKNYLAFFLSFVNIASFWRTHHHMYACIRAMNERTRSYNIGWMFFIVTLPFVTGLLSTHFGDSPAVFLYSLNIFALSVFQNAIWDSSDMRYGFVDYATITDEERQRFRLMLNFDMGNALLCVALSFFVPRIAFFVLFFKLPLFLFRRFISRGTGGEICIAASNKTAHDPLALLLTDQIFSPPSTLFSKYISIICSVETRQSSPTQYEVLDRFFSPVVRIL